jgi:hypothetical protein
MLSSTFLAGFRAGSPRNHHAEHALHNFRRPRAASVHGRRARVRRRPTAAWNAPDDGRTTMKAVTGHGKRDVRVDDVPDPKLQAPTDAIVQVTVRMGQANVRRWVDDIMPLLEGDADPLGIDDLVTHRVALADAPAAYRSFQKKEHGTIKVVFAP